MCVRDGVVEEEANVDVKREALIFVCFFSFVRRLLRRSLGMRVFKRLVSFGGVVSKRFAR